MPGGNGVRLADADVLVHAEALQPGRVVRRLVAEAPAADVDDRPARRESATRREHRVDGVARGRGETDIHHRLVLAPVLVSGGFLRKVDRIVLTALEAEHCARQVREAGEVAASLEVVAGDDGWELEGLRAVGLALPCDEPVDCPDDRFERL